MGTLEQDVGTCFMVAIASGVQAVMSAHVVYPAWDERPATVSRRILTDLLRGELGFANEHEGTQQLRGSRRPAAPKASGSFRPS